MGISLTYPPIEGGNCLCMDACDQAPLVLVKMEDQKSLTLR